MEDNACEYETAGYVKEQHIWQGGFVVCGEQKQGRFNGMLRIYASSDTADQLEQHMVVDIIASTTSELTDHAQMISTRLAGSHGVVSIIRRSEGRIRE